MFVISGNLVGEVEKCCLRFVGRFPEIIIINFCPPAACSAASSRVP